MSGHLPKTWLIALACLLAVLAGPAFALGLGQINVRSQAGEPLLAEIPIISSDPSELENLSAGLASPETFARIGLDPPDSTVAALQFSIALDPRGNPVVRVTSQQPIRQSLLTFLVEVDWGQGRLVREYSALLDTPNTVAAPAQPPIQAPTAPSNVIVRAPDPTPAPVPAPAPEPEAASPAAAPPNPAATPSPPAPVADTPREATPAAAGTAIPTPAGPIPETAPSPALRPAAQPIASTPGEYGPVKAGDTLGRIAGSLGLQGYSVDQTMLALLRANPEAFIDGNVNLIKRGAVLKVPGSDALSQLSAAEARAIVHEQIGQWRAMRTPAPQPAAVAGAAQGGDAKAAAAVPSTSPARSAEARLEIVPPSANAGRQAGTTSGIDAGGEGDMLRQELQQTKETLAARDAEVQELKTRLADLEKLQQQQQQLITLKDGKLAEAQQTLATTNAQADVAPVAAAGVASPSVALWPWLILGVVVVLLAAWLLMRRKQAKPQRTVFDRTTLPAGLPTAGAATNIEPVTVVDDVSPRVAAPDDVPGEQSVHPVRTSAHVPEPAPEPTAGPVVAAPDVAEPAPIADSAMPTWHAGRAPSSSAPSSSAPSSSPSVPDAEAIAPLEPAPSGSERIELARAYIDLGDVDTARTLLQEVADSGDAAARGEATRLLSDLV